MQEGGRCWNTSTRLQVRELGRLFNLNGVVICGFEFNIVAAEVGVFWLDENDFPTGVFALAGASL